jgi:hypothetical protein
MNSDYSTNKISDSLLNEISTSLEGKRYGSVEIYIENGFVTHITEKVIKKYQPRPVTPIQPKKKLEYSQIKIGQTKKG